MRAAVGAALLALAACGCSSQWYPGYSHSDIARTDVVIRTEPSGATILINGRKQPETSPIRLPVEYDHTQTLYERQSNYGQRMREDLGTAGSIAAAPVVGVASLFHYREDVRRHQYGNNVIVVTAMLNGWYDAEQTITLEGEATREVVIKLEPVGDQR